MCPMLTPLLILFRQYLGLTCTLILFCILVCYFIGLLCGVCSDQPTRYNYKVRSKKSEFFFYLGIVFFFLTFTCLLILSTFSFVVGGISDRSVCFYLENVSHPQSEQVVSLIQSEFQEDLLEGSWEANELKPIFSYLKNVKLAEILNRCHHNRSLFDVLQLSFDQKIRVHKKSETLKLSDIILFKEVCVFSAVWRG